MWKEEQSKVVEERGRGRRGQSSQNKTNDASGEHASILHRDVDQALKAERVVGGAEACRTVVSEAGGGEQAILRLLSIEHRGYTETVPPTPPLAPSPIPRIPVSKLSSHNATASPTRAPPPPTSKRHFHLIPSPHRLLGLLGSSQGLSDSSSTELDLEDTLHLAEDLGVGSRLHVLVCGGRGEVSYKSHGGGSGELVEEEVGGGRTVGGSGQEDR